MIRISALWVAVVAACLLSIAPASANTGHAIAKNFNDKTIAFTYPKTWQALSHGTAMEIANPLITGYEKDLTVKDAGAVKIEQGNAGDVAVIAKVAFDSKLRNGLKTARKQDTFLKAFLLHLASLKGVSTKSTGKITFAGRPGRYFDAVVKTTDGSLREQVEAAISRDHRFLYLGGLFATPPSRWRTDSSILSSVAGSAKIL